jgi:hypothetical protein
MIMPANRDADAAMELRKCQWPSKEFTFTGAQSCLQCLVDPA